MIDQLVFKKLQVKNFRNLENSPLEFSSNINCIFGLNGNGKTNILEAIYYILNRKSFRKKTLFPQLISVESEEPEILFSSVFEKESDLIPYTGKLTSEGSEWHYENKPVKRKKLLDCIFVGPTDAFAFHTTPSFRRNWFDHHFSLLSPDYRKTLNDYTASLRFRNNLLAKKPNNYIQQIEANEENFVKLTAKLIDLRESFLTEIRDFIMHTFQLLFDETHNLNIAYSSKLNKKTEADILKFFKENRDKDLILGHTKNGVHRDDFIFEFDGYNSYEYCSLGQQKMSFMSLLFAYIELFRYKFKTYPIVLLDDVSGELDERRWRNLISYLQAKKFQVFISTANESFKNELEKIEGANKIFVSDGNMEIL